MTIQLIIAETKPVVRAGLISFFQEGDVQIAGEAGTSELLIQKAKLLSPDVIIMDTWFPDESGYTTIRRLRENDCTAKIVVFSSDDKMTNLAKAKACGANSWLSLGISRAELVRLIRLIVIDSESAAAVGELRRVSGVIKKVRNEKMSVLTTREKQVLYYITLGLSNKEIAATLNLSRETIKEHVCNILRKLDVRDRTEAAVWAVKNNIII